MMSKLLFERKKNMLALKALAENLLTMAKSQGECLNALMNCT